MWQLDNQTPFAAARSWVRDREGAELWLVVVKSTFAVGKDSELIPFHPQPPVAEAPCWYGDPGRSSLRSDLDLVRTKTTTDVLVHGNAYAPRGRPAQRVEVGLRVGPVHKLLRVSGDRRWRVGPTGLSMTEPEFFIKMPLVYERAFGGVDASANPGDGAAWDVRNPVGTGWAVKSHHLQGVLLPNIEYVDATISSWNERPPPAGFGPICSHWEPRARLGGTHDEAWQAKRFPLTPEDLDDRFFQSAPRDQLPPRFLEGGEPVRLTNLSATGVIDFVLPRVDLRFTTVFDDGAEEEHKPPSLHSVILEPDFPRVSLVHHTSLPCHDRGYKLQETRIEVRGEFLNG